MSFLLDKLKGACEGRGGFLCNNNFIGNMSCLDDNSNHENETSHITHVASMEGGKFLMNISFFHGGQATKMAAGTSLVTHLAIYNFWNPHGFPY
jgi:hypothetical protein